MSIPETWAAEWVTAGRGGLELGGVVDPPVRLQGHSNPAVAAGELAAVRAFLAAAISEAFRRAGAALPTENE